MKKHEPIKRLEVFRGPMTFTAVMPEDVADLKHLVLLEIAKPANGSYLMTVKDSTVDGRRMTVEEIFEAWMVMGHTIKHLVGDYKKELIEYMVKEFRTREQLEKENAQKT